MSDWIKLHDPSDGEPVYYRVDSIVKFWPKTASGSPGCYLLLDAPPVNNRTGEFQPAIDEVEESDNQIVAKMDLQVHSLPAPKPASDADFIASANAGIASGETQTQD